MIILFFFGYYNNGNSITRSWHTAAIRECAKNYPVTVAYGGTEEETAHILFDERFKKNRGNTGWIIAVVSFTPGLWDQCH